MVLVLPNPNDFLSRLLTMDKTLLYSYDPETRNNKWSGGIVAQLVRPRKIPSAKVRWKSSCLDFLGSKQHIPH
jgi:hypothetical protein